ncbi:MAG: glutamate-5-semialdehyde dehydrogenase [Chitinophagaceae bacterium]
MNSIHQQIKKTRQSATTLLTAKETLINKILNGFANELISNSKKIIKANQADIAALEPGYTKKDRLLLNEDRIKQIAASIKKVAELPNPCGHTLLEKTLPNGLKLEKISVPLGVVSAIYESRPNVTADIAALCIKSRNGCVLKGSRDAHHTNTILVKLFQKVLSREGLDKHFILLLPPQREVLQDLFTATRLVDVIIPRGSDSLIQYVRKNSLVPVIETGAGVCHVYVHKDADLDMAVNIVYNAKTSRPSVCNAMDTVIVDESVAGAFLSKLSSLFKEKEVIVYADKKSFTLLKGYPFLYKATEQDFYREFLSLTCAVKLVKNEQQALAHIEEHSTKHSEAIVTKNKKVAAAFLQTVDAATVYHNASTRFTDGEEFGLGAEIGISTQKLHARGPFALEKLVTEKWVVKGNGQVR